MKTCRLHRVALGLVAIVALPSADARAGWNEEDRLRLAADGRVDAALIDALDAADEAPIVVVYRQPGGPAGTVSNRSAVADGLLAALRPGDFRVAHRYESVNGMAGRISRGGLLRLLANANVVRVGIDRPITAQLAEAVPMVSLDDLQIAGHDGSGQIVAVIDTGIDRDHEDLTGAVIAEQCFCQGADGPGGSGCCPNGLDSDSGTGSAEDDHGHGTRVAGILVSNGSSAPVGGAPGAELVSIKVLASNASGSFSDLVAGLDWIVSNRPDVTVVNLSLGGGLFPGDCDAAGADIGMAADKIEQLWSQGVPTMAGSGNNGSGTGMIAPACISTAIAVSAVWDADLGSETWLGCTDPVTAPDLVTCFANSSTTTDLFAPGAVMTSSRRNGGATNKAGTSYATPIVAACAAVLFDAVPGMSPSQLEAAIEASLIQVTDPKNGLTFPRLDCARALYTFAAPTPAVRNPGLIAIALGILGAAFATRFRAAPKR
jgi:subtilisin family serine protease